MCPDCRPGGGEGVDLARLLLSRLDSLSYVCTRGTRGGPCSVDRCNQDAKRTDRPADVLYTKVRVIYIMFPAAVSGLLWIQLAGRDTISISQPGDLLAMLVK